MSDESERIAGGLEVLVISLRQCVTIGPRLTQKVADHMELAEKLVREQMAEIAALRAQVEALSAERDAALNRSSDLMATNGRLRQQIEAFRDQVAGDCL